MTESKNIFETKEGGEQKSGKTGGQDKSGKTGGQDKSGKTGGQDKSGKTGGQDKSGKTGGSKNGGTGGKVDITLNTPKDKKEGDSFRAWMKQTNPTFKCDDGTSLLEKGSYNNSCITKAWKQFKDKYSEFINSGKTVVVGKTGGFPVNTIELSNMFREWVSDNHSGYIQKNSTFKTSITDPKEIADEVFKKAWFEYDGDYIYYLTSNSNSILSSIGTQLSKDYEAWKKSDEAKMSGLELQRRDREFQKKKCEPWESGNLIDRKLPSSNDNDKNSFAEKFIEWADSEGYIDLHLPSQFCGEDKSSGIQWVYQNWVDDNNKSYFPYQHPIVRYMSLLPMWVYDEVRGVDTKSNLFNKFLKSNRQEVTTGSGSNNTNTGTKGTSTVSTTNVVKINPNLLSAARNVERNLSRQNCRSLNTEIKKVGGSTTDNFINTQITKCEINYASTFNESIKNKITGKLKVMKENKSLNESVINKIKSKKNEKTLSTLSEQFNKQNYRKFLTQIMEHTKSLQNSNGIITENIEATFEKAFNSLFLGNESKMKEQTINHILRELKVEPSSKIGIEITNELNSTPDSEVTRLLSDPTYVADKISSAIDKSIESDNVTDDSLESMLKSSTVNKMRSTMDDVKFKIANRLTSVLDSARQNVERTSNEVKQSFIDKLSSKIAEF
jgi:hypothetical protein